MANPLYVVDKDGNSVPWDGTVRIVQEPVMEARAFSVPEPEIEEVTIDRWVVAGVALQAAIALLLLALLICEVWLCR